MPRVARVVFEDLPHHVTQRGNRREKVFFSDADRRMYLGWLERYSREHGVAILAYCLMSNHVHLVAVPARADSLQRMLKPLHMRYAQQVNRARGWSGHLWQGRFFSSPLDEDYMFAAIRYAERNPVRARLVRKAVNYPWSSAAAHCGGEKNDVLTREVYWIRTLGEVRDWSAWLGEGDEDEQLSLIRRNVDKGLPCGSDGFIKKLSRLAGRTLQFRPPGRPKETEKGQSGYRPSTG